MPIHLLIGKIAKFPIKPPMFIIEITSEASSKLSGPVVNVVFSFCNSMKLIVAHPLDVPNDRVNKLPILKDIQ